MQNLVGKTLGKYRLVARLGSGGMAEVYKAFQPGLDRYVAIKVMHDHLSTDEVFVKRFHREARATGRLTHPNIVHVLDFDQEAGIYFIVMQFINGPTLKTEFSTRRQQKRSFSLPELGRIYLALGDAVDYAHARDMIHRDIKPGNIMINQDGQLLLTDFGITRLLDGTQFTTAGAITGTPAYMSPEQGRGTQLDGRSDLYTLGIILYELVTGRVPYQADTPVATVMKHIKEPLPPPRGLNPNLPAEVEQVILRALEKEPANRYQTGQALAEALGQAVNLAPGDTLARNPLRVTAPPPEVTDEVDPRTGTFHPAATVVSQEQPTLQPDSSQATRVRADQATRVRSAPSAGVGRGWWLWLAGGGLLLLSLIVAGGLGLGLWSASGPAESTPGQDPTGTAAAQIAAAETATATAERAAQQRISQAATATAAWLAADDDRDGWSNEEEQERGTLPDVRDTDQDEIDDADEVNRYGTDPLLSDTDGDGLKDGFEVSRALDPLSEDTDGDGLPDARDPDPAHTPTPPPTATSPPTATPTPSPSPTVTNTPTVAPSATLPPPPTPTPIPPSPTPTPLSPTDQRVAELVAGASPMGADKTGLLLVNCHSTDTVDWYVEAPRNEHRLVAQVPPAKNGRCGTSHVEGFFITQTYDFGFTAPSIGTQRYLFTDLPATEVGVLYFQDGEIHLEGLAAADFRFCAWCQ